MILDLHTHSVKSDDSRARVESYCKWIRKRDVPIDGFVLTEHRQYDDVSDYRELEDRFGLLILKASEVETDYGHVLVFGVNEDMRAAFDFQAIDLDLRTVLVEAERCGGVAVPCHPGRPRVGLFSHYTERGPVDGVRVVEVLNGGSRGDEDAISREQAQKHGYLGTGGSDSHIVSHIGRCATRFEPEIRAIGDLVQALRGEQFEAVAQR